MCRSFPLEHPFEVGLLLGLPNQHVYYHLEVMCILRGSRWLETCSAISLVVVSQMPKGASRRPSAKLTIDEDPRDKRLRELCSI